MINNIFIRKIRYFIKDYWVTLVTVGSVFIISILLLLSYSSYKSSLDNLDILDQEVKLLKNRTDTLRYNKTLTEDQITAYNKLLTMLIPETEDYFSVIYALEAISIDSNFNIVGYTINFSKSSRDKMSITIEGRGDIGSFMNFLKKYQFAGARLATSEKIQYSGNMSNTKINLNFYAKKFTFNDSVVPQLTEKDIQLLENIKSKISVNLIGGATDNTPEDYDTKDNPF